MRIYCIAAFFLCCIAHAQVGNVGINTTTPRVKLDVNGTYKSQEIISGNISNVGAGEKDRYLLLGQSNIDNSVKRIDPSQGNAPGIASIITYKLTNADLDWVESFNTKINSTDYSLMVLSAYFDRDVVGNVTAIPSYGVKSVNNEWIIYADYSQLASTTNGTWTVVCAVYPKTYVKIYSEKGPFNLQGTSTGTDASPILQ
ncbi:MULTISPECIES: hypothetical protein [Chryseobacterium]|uniref:DUF5017 domain-containing protein n=1 Tax=Chryseobacterium camelliae TaxID=1265445 RepID=A0ABU0TGL6_9FLAO|nr:MULTISPECIES: hypothetical protein [Chryseobacterium]MDT3406088.1 hypothetical protein [Pseudacidovorax intermedius]MDQ1096111.1 hypothetical protein [Chryseobacterium camelliae]MDQ1100047.1 hypothetical protein [Chryseobacterium sp. SORGH_AS_1048]MDR6087390.1 hypothetical protein [Chryseobacterium sp. SORGH_AS_0909]MDR6131765.1 hypothetical protein [Chryseobacterium sp. SORGH_AS_1175]